MKYLGAIFILLPIFLQAQTGIQNMNTIDKIDLSIKYKVDEFILSKIDSFHIPGLAIAVVKDNEIIYTQGYGYSNLELKTPIVPESKFLIGSITKSFTAVALMMLWEKGEFSLSDPIGNYVDDIPEFWKPLTIEQLLNHTSGIATNLEMPPPCSFEFDFDHYTRMNYFQEVMCLPLEFIPGTQWKYSGATGYDLLGVMIEKLSGDNYYEFIRKNIYVPSLMKESYWIDYDSVIPNRVDGYYFVDGVVQNSDKLDAIGEYAHGGLMSSILDLIKFDKALFEETLVKKSTLELMLTNSKLTNGMVAASYGLGFGLTPYEGHERIGHTGSAPGYSTAYSRFINKNLSIIVLTNKESDYGMLKFSNEIAQYFLD